MTVEMTKQMLLDMVQGTGGPGNYTDKFNHIGELQGFPNEKWQWKLHRLMMLDEENLLALYHALKAEK